MKKLKQNVSTVGATSSRPIPQRDDPKQNKGITLIALVITIIVLLILAGVTINMLTGDSGILKNAQDSETQYTRAAIIEIAEIAYDTGTIEKITGSNTQKKEDLVATELIKAGYNVKIENGATPITEINLSKENLNLYIDSEDEIINITYQDGYENKDSRYFVEVKGLYYELIFQSKKITLAESPTTLEHIDTEASTLEITTDDEEKNIIEILTVGQTITIIPKGLGTATITVKHGSITKTCTITVANPPMTASEITSTDIGKTVTNYTMGGQTWEILYADEENIYLITNGVVSDPKYNAKTLANPFNAGTYSEGSSLLSNSEKFPVASKWMKSWLESGYTSTYDNMQAILFMLDSTVWNETYKNEYADYAVGGPTLELLTASYNKVKGSNLSVAPSSATGYERTITAGLTVNTAWNHGNEYWLASPAYSENVNHAYMVHYVVSYDNGYVNAMNLSNNVSFRPIVCLNSEVELIETTDSSGNLAYAIKTE